MPKIKVTDRLPSQFVSAWKPLPGMKYTVTVLDPDPIHTCGHWIRDAVHGVSGRYACINGVCCEAYPMGSDSAQAHRFAVPIYVYDSPETSLEGSFYAWDMTYSCYKSVFQPVAISNDLSQYDLLVSVEKRGMGVQLQATVITTKSYHKSWTQDLADKATEFVNQFNRGGDAQFARDMDDARWRQLLTGMGYDFQNKTFPAYPGVMQPVYGGGMMQSLSSPGYMPQPGGMQAQASVQYAAPRPIPAPVAAVHQPVQAVQGQPAQVVVGQPPSPNMQAQFQSPPAAQYPQAQSYMQAPGQPITQDELAQVLDV